MEENRDRGEEHAHGATEHGATEERPRVLVFFDYACPFCYLDQSRIESLASEIDFEMVLVPFELRPDMPEEGWQISELEAEGHSDRVHDHLIRAAEKERLPLTVPGFLPNTHKALSVAEVARDEGDALHRTVHREIFHAYFGRGLDIGDEGVLLQLARESGLDTEIVTAALHEDRYADRLHQFRHVALHLGIDATPATLICNELIIGSRPTEVLRTSLERCGVRVHGDEEALES